MSGYGYDSDHNNYANGCDNADSYLERRELLFHVCLHRCCNELGECSKQEGDYEAAFLL